MRHLTLARFIAPLALGGITLGCAIEPAADEAETTESAVISDAVSITRRDDGSFDVVCRGANGAPSYDEIASEQDVVQNRVCKGPATHEPTFDVDTCGASLTTTELRRFFLSGATSANLGTITLRFRERRCNDFSGCTAWSDLPTYASIDASAELLVDQSQQTTSLGLLVHGAYAGNAFGTPGRTMTSAGRVHDDGNVPHLSLLEYRVNGGNIQLIKRNVPLEFNGRLGAECGYFRSEYAYADPQNDAQSISLQGVLTIRYPAQ